MQQQVQASQAVQQNIARELQAQQQEVASSAEAASKQQESCRIGQSSGMECITDSMYARGMTIQLYLPRAQAQANGLRPLQPAIIEIVGNGMDSPAQPGLNTNGQPLPPMTQSLSSNINPNTPIAIGSYLINTGGSTLGGPDNRRIITMIEINNVLAMNESGQIIQINYRNGIGRLMARTDPRRALDGQAMIAAEEARRVIPGNDIITDRRGETAAARRRAYFAHTLAENNQQGALLAQVVQEMLRRQREQRQRLALEQSQAQQAQQQQQQQAVALSRQVGLEPGNMALADSLFNSYFLYQRMHTQLNNPGNAHGNINTYPNSQFETAQLDVEPSIRGKQLYIPLGAFFCDSSKLALPLVALQYQEINIRIELKPIMDLYTINDVEATPGNNGLSYRMRPNKNILHQELWRFLQAPKDKFANTQLYNQNAITWAADPHLIGTYVFLGQAERRIFAAQEHKILIKQIYEYDFQDVNGSRIVEIESKDMVSNYMWRFRRSDAYLRNEWSNYTNWPYHNVIPQSVQEFNIISMPNPANHYITGNIGVLGADNAYPINLKEIMIDLGITMDGVYREKVLPAGVYEYMEKYMRTQVEANGLYIYNFCLDSNKKTYQPSGAMNVNKFKKVFFEFNTIEPPIDLSGSNIEYICDLSGNAIGFRKTTAQLNEYSFDLKIFEERYNIMVIQGGRVGLYVEDN